MQDDDAFIETAGFDAFQFQMANGNNVKIVFARFWEKLTDTDRMLGAKPQQYVAFKVYSSENILSNRMAVQYEFRAGHEFGLVAVPQIWRWLEVLVENRGHVEYDSLEDFVQDFAEQIAQFTDLDEDAVEHIEHLPEITDPEAFDKVDDSIFNDQNDSKPER